MMREICRISLIIALLIVILSCNRKEEDEYIARVNDEILTLSELKSIFSEDEWQDLNENNIEEYLDEWIYLTMLSQESESRGICEQPVILQKINNGVKKIKANALIANELSKIEVSEEDLLSYYQLHRSDYRNREKEYKYQRIMVNSKEKVQRIAEELKNGAKFKDMAIRYSEEEVGKTGGYMGFVSRNKVPVEIWETLESLQHYNWKSLKLGDKYFIVRWYEVRELDIEKPFSDVKEDIEQRYIKENRKDKFNELILDIEESCKIEKKYFLLENN